MKRILVIPTLGESPFLEPAIDSARALGTGWRVVLVCPAARADYLKARYLGCEVVAETAGGLYGAINTGLRSAAEWDWFSYLNDDDLVTEAVAPEPPAGADIVYGRVDYIDAGGRRLGSFPVEPRPNRLPVLLAGGVPALTPQGTVISRRAFEALGGFDARLRYCGDFDFWLRASVNKLVFVHRPATVGAFRLHAGQLSQQQDAAAAELAGVCAAHAPGRSGVSVALARTAFRLRNLPLTFERRRLTGHWRSRALFNPPAP